MSVDKFTKTPTPIEVVEKVNSVIDNLGDGFDGYWEAGEAVAVGDMRYIAGRDNVGYVLECIQAGTTGTTAPSVSDDDIGGGAGVGATDMNNLAGVLGLAKGGTGATSAAGALTNLGITASATELNFCDGVTSAIQTQLNGKLSTSGTAAKATADGNGNNIASTYAPKASPTFTGTATLATANATSASITTLSATTLTVSTTLNIPGGKIWIA